MPQLSVIIFLLVLACADASYAQTGRGAISGRIVDETGGVIQFGDVSATHDETGVITRTRSNEQGLFRLVNLPIGGYDVEVRHSGFRPFVHTDVTVQVASAISLDVTLLLGEMTAGLTVTSDAPARDTHSSGTGAALSQSVVTNLPLTITSGRSIENFAYAVAPGAEGNNWTSAVVGGASFTKEVIVDGTSATIQIQGHINESSPPMDAVEEFKVQTSGMSAEYGRTGGGIFNFSLRSGTNALRGGVYGQLRNEMLNANSWMNTALGKLNPAQSDLYRKPRDRQRVEGVTVGGPIAAGRTFYFAAFEEYNQTRRELGRHDRTVPTPEFLDGNFAALLDTAAVLGRDAAGQPIYSGAIFDPVTKLVFPGNVIPRERLSAVSQRIADIYRQAYRPLVPGRLIGNAAGPAYIDPEFTQHQLSLKVDHHLTATGRLAGSLIWTRRPRTLVDQGGVWDQNDDMGGPLSKSRRHEVTTYQGRVSYTHPIAPSVLNVATFTMSRFRNPSTTGSADGDWPRQLGLSANGAHGSFPQINFGDPTNGIDETDIGYGVSNYYVGKVAQYNDHVTWITGRHLFKFGGEARFMAMDSYGDRPYLEYHFSRAQTGVQGGPDANQVGFGFASFLLGEVERASLHVPADFFGSRNYIALFAQDDIRLSDRFTVNLGLRWETTSGWREKHGRWSNFNTGEINPATGARGTLEFGDKTTGAFEGDRDLRQFGPRVGLAYQIRQRLVFRSSYGVFYAPIGNNYWAGVPYGFAPGFFGTNTVVQRADGAAAFNWDKTAYPGTFVPATQDPAYTQWGMVSVNPNSLRAGRIQQWNAGIDYDLARGLIVGAAYLGNRGSRLASGDLERNQPDPAKMKQLLSSGTEWNWVADTASAAAAGVPYPYPGFAGAAWMAITPYPQAAAGWGPLFFVGSPLGRSDYHALQLTMSRQSASGISTMLGYTLSRHRSNIDSGFQERWWSGPIQDVTHLDREGATIAAGDRTHVLKGYAVWPLPFGAGRRYLSSASRLTNALVGGWSVSGIFRYESGLPLGIRSGNAYAGWHYPIYGNRVPGTTLDASFDEGRFNPADPAAPANQYFNARAFANPAYGELGTTPARLSELRGFGAAYEDLGIIKENRIGRYSLQIRLEILNLFNRRYLADPETNLGSPYFGQVVGAGWQPPRQGQLGVRFQW